MHSHTVLHQGVVSTPIQIPASHSPATANPPSPTRRPVELDCRIRHHGQPILQRNQAAAPAIPNMDDTLELFRSTLFKDINYILFGHHTGMYPCEDICSVITASDLSCKMLCCNGKHAKARARAHRPEAELRAPRPCSLQLAQI